MKILYVTTISNTVNAFLIPHIKMLIDEGHQVDVAFNIDQEVNSQIYELGCKIHQLPFNRSPLKKENFRAYRMLEKIIPSEGYNLVHTHTPVASAVVRLACRKLNGVKVYYTAHGFHFFKGAPLKNWLIYFPVEKWLSKYTESLITINEEDYNTAKNKKFKSKKIELVSGVGMDLNKFIHPTKKAKELKKLEYGYSIDDFILFYAAELNDNKNQELLIRATKMLKKDIPNLKLLLAGKGEKEEYYQNLTDELSLTNEIHFLGYRTDIKELLVMSDIVVSASNREGLPVNIMEAMATGLPIIATDVRGNRDLIENGINGYLVPKGDQNKLVECVLKIYESKEIREKFQIETIKKVQQYSIEKITEQTKYIYQDMD